METTENPYELPHQQLIIDLASQSFLQTTARWAKILAVIGFVMIGFIILVAIYITSTTGVWSQTGLQNFFMTAIYSLMGLLYFFPTLYLYRFAVKMQEGLQDNDQEMVRESFQNLKSLFRFVGILTVVCIGIYGLMLFAVGIGAGFMG